MNSRERVNTVLNHKIPDRIPIDFGATTATGIAAQVYNKLKKKAGVEDKPAYMNDFLLQLVTPEQEFLDMFHVDVVDGSRAFKDNIECREWILNDGSKVLTPKFYNIEEALNGTVFIKNSDGIVLGKKPKSSLYTEQSYWVYGNLPAIPENIKSEDLRKHLWAIPRPPWHLNLNDATQFDNFVSGIKNLYEQTDYSIALTVGGSIFEGGQFLRGMENFLCDLYIDKKGVKKLLDRIVDNYLVFFKKVIEGAGKYIDVLRFSDDLGSQDRPIISPDIFREILKPRYKKMWDYIHDNSKLKVMLHSCGSIYIFLPDLIEAGADIINPVQTNAMDMDPVRLKREFGKDLIFWGGCCDTQNILVNGSTKDVEEDVKRRIDILGKDGGLIFSQIHNIQADVTPENIIALFNSAYKYGFYNK